jgi:hypothetical protein
VTDYAARLADPSDPLLPILRAWKACGGGRSPSVFMGRPVVTTHQYLNGQQVRSETVEWTPDDLAMAMALEAYEAGLCPGCATPLSETADPKHNPGEPAEYEELETVLCRKCVVRQKVAKRYEDDEFSSAILSVVGVKHS